MSEGIYNIGEEPVRKNDAPVFNEEEAKGSHYVGVDGKDTVDELYDEGFEVGHYFCYGNIKKYTNSDNLNKTKSILRHYISKKKKNNMRCQLITEKTIKDIKSKEKQ